MRKNEKNKTAKSGKNFSLFTFRFSLKILCACVFLWFLFFGAACQKNNNSDSSGGSGLDVFGLTDQTQEVAQTVAEANQDLKKIREMDKKNQSKVGELKTAMDDKRIDEVKKIAGELVYIINDGFLLGENAISKIEKARELNTNETYKEYLRLKEESLRTQLEAFEYRRQFAQLLRNEFGTKDKFEIDKVKTAFQDKEENFQKKWEIARDLSGQANQLAKDSQQQKAN